MTVLSFIKRDFISASAFVGVADIKEKLIEHTAVVIMEDDQYFGVLTTIDIVKKPHILAIDCISLKSNIKTDTTVSEALFLMKRDFTDVLPVFDKKIFVGLIFKSDVLEYFNERNQELQHEVNLYSRQIADQNTEFKIKIQEHQQELEKIIEQRTKELIDLVETKEKFIRIIIHELRNPFNSILGFLSLLLKNLHNYDIDKIEKFLTRVYQSSQITFDLLVNLSEWLNAKNNRIPFNPEMAGISELLNDELLTTSLIVEQKKIKLANNVPENLLAYVDKNMIRTIFRNLIINAVKFTDINGEIDVSGSESEQYVEISIKDTGIGISPEILEKVFGSEGFTSFVGTENETGTGLGLLLCKEFVEIEGGKIWVESTLGEGSEFKFTLPKFSPQDM